MSDAAADKTARQHTRNRGLGILAVVVLIAGALFAAYWLLFLRHYITTDDAYVGGDVVAITSREPGVVLAVHGDNTQIINAGQVLVELDPLTASVGMQAAEADLGR